MERKNRASYLKDDDDDTDWTQIKLCGDTGAAATTSKNLLRSQSGLTQSFQRRAGDTLFVGIKCIDWALATLETPPPFPTLRTHKKHQDVSTLLSHTSIPKNVCATSTCCTSGLSTPCSWEPSASTNPCNQPFPVTHRHYRLAERDRRAYDTMPQTTTSDADSSISPQAPS